MRNIIELLYRSKFGIVMSFIARSLAYLKKPSMIYGYIDEQSRSFRKYTRISDSVIIMSPEKLSIGDYVWVWHHSILDATEGLEIGEGCQIGAWVGIFTHGSQNAIRLYGREYVNIAASLRKGYTRSKVKIGDYTFLGAGSIVLPGVTIGKGCIIAAGTLVTKDIPDYAIAKGSPAIIVGDTRSIDKDLLQANPSLIHSYYNTENCINDGEKI